MKMNRIASSLLYGIALLLCMVLYAKCTDERVDPPGPGKEELPKNGQVSLKILVPRGSISTYADTDASSGENYIDTLFVDLFDNSLRIKQDTFPKSKLTALPNTNDSIVTVGYEVDNITTGKLYAEVYANRRDVKDITGEIPIPVGNTATKLFMSGKDSLRYTGTGYAGTIHLVRDVAKVRVNISKHSVVLPSDLVIDYDNIKIKVLKVPKWTSLFSGEDAAITAPHPIAMTYIDYMERGPGLRHSSTFDNTAGGQIDSFYINEHYLSSYTPASGPKDETTGNTTRIKVTIPTTSASEGSKSDSYVYDLHTTSDGYKLLRNYIYTLDIKVRGQNLEPVITVSVLPWDDVNIDGNIYGTYLTLSTSEIRFDATGKATIDFCTDAQAVYFDYTNFNEANSEKIGFEILPDGIENAISGLAPAGFKDGQILLDQQHCGSFSFRLDPPSLAVNFSGQICMKAGNIIKCLTFPGIRIYDAHFIVGDGIFGSDTYTNATVYEESQSGWLKISTSRLYTSAASTTYSGAAVSLYLHLDENLTGSSRSGSVVVTSDGREKKLRITQLPAIKVGRFGYTTYPNTPVESYIFDTELYTEQLHEYDGTASRPVPVYSSTTPITPDSNFVFNGWGTTSKQFNQSGYDNGFIYYQTPVVYQAINYCAYKNRDMDGNGTISGDEIKWFLPSQAQLLGMWVSYTSYKGISTSDFPPVPTASGVSHRYWSATANKGQAANAQFVDFRFGNVGSFRKNITDLVRCVRSGTASNTSMILPGTSVIDFGIGNGGMPAESYTTTPKGDAAGNELSANNATLFRKLRVATADILSTPWDLTACNSYSESAITGWRLPTQRELQAIWILQSEIKAGFSTFPLMGNEYYWSATEASTPTGNAWTIWGNCIGDPGSVGNAPNRLKGDNIRIRCVKEEWP
ncbi:MAG: hypothetical protein LBJ47_09020 [Tannerella sp.]|jgi:hypothetical protein|nr:hypothetical protein [Tannerella sp.]